MVYIKRDIEDKIIVLSKEYSCILITGPRQVGKTTVLKKLMDDDREYVTLDDMEERSLAKRDPTMFLQMHSTPIRIDEVQYAPELFSYIKIQIDNGAAPGAYWLTSSESFNLMELAQESLAGRVALQRCPILPVSKANLLYYGISSWKSNVQKLSEQKGALQPYRSPSSWWIFVWQL